MKNILLCTDGSSFAENVYKYGAWFALKFGCHVNVLFVTDIRSQQVASTGNLSGTIGLGSAENLLHELVNLEHQKAKLNNQRARLILQNAAAILKAEGVTDVQLTNKTGFLVDCFDEFEKDADLIVLGKRGEGAEFASGHLGANIDRIVRSSTKPCLVTPQEFKPISRLLVAYDGSATGNNILQFLAAYPVFTDLEIHLLTVAKTGKLETATQTQHQGQLYLQTVGYEPVCSVLEGDPETVITNYISQADISFLLMGAYGHSRIRHLVIGSTTAQLLRSTKIPVLLFR